MFSFERGMRFAIPDLTSGLHFGAPADPFGFRRDEDDMRRGYVDRYQP